MHQHKLFFFRMCFHNTANQTDRLWRQVVDGVRSTCIFRNVNRKGRVYIPDVHFQKHSNISAFITLSVQGSLAGVRGPGRILGIPINCLEAPLQCTAEQTSVSGSTVKWVKIRMRHAWPTHSWLSRSIYRQFRISLLCLLIEIWFKYSQLWSQLCAVFCI